ncbi:unnamed protein product [Angiostrongylus costaricensis]|uniref:MSP domain-containing protein n=1 Tax=Angiostrongylus costaricensis TaxID=334426 RepID=A0A0R3PB26_ANGCS|nr:unnamed protein product [Angiostrongylus costaricensis]
MVFVTLLLEISPFTDIVNAHLQLKNPTERAVCFKVKTTAPKQYSVRRKISMSRHKFMVQTCFCPSGDVDLENIWKVCILDFIFYKLMVVFQQRGDDQQVVVREEAPSAVSSIR